MRQLAGVFVGLLLTLSAAPVAAHAAGCYPPPCASPAASTAQAVPAPGPLNISSSQAPGDPDGPLPFVAGGLLVISSALSVIVLSRRMAMVRRSDSDDVSAAASAATVARVPRREPSRSFS